MKTRTFILQSFSLSCLLAGILVFGALTASANDLALNSDKDKGAKKTENRFLLGAMPKMNLSMDGFRSTGMLTSEFKLTPSNSWNIKSVMTYKRGNVTYVLPYNVQIQQPSNMEYHKLRIILPLK
ncbi:hypothetical protein F0L74_17130 [Chitinophaga agrisoli]|uniref:Uncharacterized protein n=1 Tax=Chitinophaga agrisoli TaxID=2607653 RepID=A0A5B2VU20_9BACT|nr:hypothetical protein [Chitinophaga agrisoli]KAA2241609.1 hypothetical protein F0L74_17130 [Chitinophaga agrisoli]